MTEQDLWQMISINIVAVFQCTLFSKIIAQIHDIFHSKAAFGRDDNWLQDAGISLMLQLSQFKNARDLN